MTALALRPPVFPVGVPARSGDLVGRDAAVAELVLRLASGQNILLFGPRRTGKTTVAEAALAALRGQGHLAARVDLTYTPSKRAVAAALGGAVLEAAGARLNAIEQLRAAPATLSPELTLRREVGPEAAEIVLRLAAPPDRSRDRDEDAALRDALSLPERIAVRRHCRFVLCLDEFQEAGRLDAGMYRLIRAEIAGHRQTTYLFMGSQGSLLSGLFARRNEPLYQFATIWTLPPVPAEAWVEFIAARYRDVGLRSTAVGVEALVACAGAHPMHTMLVAQEAFVLAATGEGLVDADVAAAAHAAAARALAPAFEEAWRSLPTASRAALQAVARGDSPWSAQGPRASKRAMDVLLDRGVLVRAGRGRYRFVEALFEEFVRSVG